MACLPAWGFDARWGAASIDARPRYPTTTGRLRIWSTLLAALTCFLAAPVLARPNPGPMVTEQDVLGKIPVVLSVTRLAQPVSRAPASVTVIDRQMIDASGARTIPDVLALVPGFYVGYKSGNQPMVTYHGLSDVYSRRLQVLIDGRSVYNAASGGVSWSDLPISLADVKRIEVIRGPDTASYGANAFLAVISIHTYSGSEVAKNTAEVLHGTRGERRAYYRHASQSGDTSYRVTLQSSGDDLYDSKNDFRHTQLMTFRGDRRLSVNDTLELKFGFLGGVRAHGNHPDGSDHHNSSAHSNYEQLRWHRKLGLDDDLSIQFYHNATNYRERYVDVHSIPRNYDISVERYDLELQRRMRPGPTTRLVWGLDARVDQARSLGYLYDRSPSFRSSQAFANLEWFPIPKVSINLGAMLEHNNYTGTALSPRVGITYQIRPGHTLRAIVSKAIRVPTIIEEQADSRLPSTPLGTQVLAGNPNLQCERILSREIGYYGRFDRRLFVDVKIYRDSISNLITLLHSPLPARFYNTDNVTISGAEVQFDYRPNRSNRAFLGYAYTHIDGADVANNYTSSAPPHSLSLLLIHDFSHRIEGSMAYYYLGPVWPLDGKLIPHTRRLDLRLAKDFRLGGDTGQLALVWQSVLGDYEEYQTDTLFRRTAYVSLKLNF